MFKRVQFSLPESMSAAGLIPSLLLAAILLALTVFATLAFLPFEGWQPLAVVITTALMACAGVMSAVLCWKGKSSLGILILILTFWAGIIFMAWNTEGLGLVMGIGAFVIASALAVQALPVNQISQVMGVGTLVGGAAFMLDFLSKEERFQFPVELQSLVFRFAGLAILIFAVILVSQFRKLNLLTKLLIPIVFILLLSVGILTAYNNAMTRRALLNSENQALGAAAQQTSTAIVAFLNASQTALVSEAKLPLFVNYLSLPAEERPGSALETETLSLLRSLQARGYVLSYSILDPTGRVLLSTLSVPAQVAELPANLGITLTDPGFLSIILLTGEPYISPVIFTPGGEPSLYFAVRIDNAAGNPVGVLVSQFHASNLQVAVAQSNNLVGAGSFAVLVDENNLRLGQGGDPTVLYKMLVPPDPQTYTELVATRRIPDLAFDQVATNYPMFTEGLSQAGTNLSFFTTQEAGTGEQINSAAAIRVANRKWTVVFMQPQSAFLQPIEEQTRTAMLLAISVAILVSFLVGLVARFIVRPILRLTQVTKVVTEGDLTAQAKVTSQDEIGSLASAFNTMTAELRQTLEGLEQRVHERTIELEKASDQMSYRANQLQTVSDVARAIASVQGMEQLLPLITQTISERFNFYHCGIFLLDTKGEYAVLQAANSEGGLRMLARGHRLRVGQVGIVGYVTDRGVARIALDVGQDAVFFNNPDLPETRSEMALPLKIGERVIGALDVQSKMSSAFSDEDIALLTTLADQVAIAIENARLFGETRQALVEAQTAQRDYLRSEWEKVVTQQNLVGYQYTYGRISNLQQAGDELVWDELDPRSVRILSAAEDAVQSAVPVQPQNPEQTLLIPIALRGQVIGMFKLQDIDPDRTWHDEEIALIKSVADQVGLALENARLLETTQRRAEREYLVGQITTKMRASNDPQVILQAAITELRKALRVQKAQVIIQAHANQEHDLQSGENESSEKEHP